MSTISKSMKSDLSKENAVITRNNTLCNFVRETISSRCIFRFKSADNNMMPAITKGQVITLAPFYEKSPALGDVVAFEHPITGDLAVHRIIAIQKGNYTLKGDNNRQIINRLPLEKIIARAAGVDKKKYKYCFINLFVKIKLYLRDLDLFLLPYLCGEKNVGIRKSTTRG